MVRARRMKRGKVPERFVWDLEDDPDGNFWHIVVEGHGISQDEVEEVLSEPDNPSEQSRSSGERITFGRTRIGNYIAVVWELVDEDPRTVRPITAFHAPPPKR